MSHSYQLYCHVGVQIVPLAANHQNPKPQRDELPAKLSPLGFPFGLYMECNNDLPRCYSFRHTLYLLNSHISLGLLDFTQMIDVQNPSINCVQYCFTYTPVSNAWKHMAEECCRSEGILAISVSRDNPTVWPHYNRLRVIAYL